MVFIVDGCKQVVEDLIVFQLWCVYDYGREVVCYVVYVQVNGVVDGVDGW